MKNEELIYTRSERIYFCLSREYDITDCISQLIKELHKMHEG